MRNVGVCRPVKEPDCLTVDELFNAIITPRADQSGMSTNQVDFERSAKESAIADRKLHLQLKLFDQSQKAYAENTPVEAAATSAVTKQPFPRMLGQNVQSRIENIPEA